MIRNSFLRNSVSSAALFAALAIAPTTADAARCFGKETSAQKAGNATAVRGPDVGLKKAAAADFARPAAGADVFGGDRVRTGDQSILQVKLCDWSTYTFSPDSESDINEFYSADGAQRRRVVNFLRGGMRLLSGKESGPDDTEVKFEEAGVTMGVRGTGVVIVELDGLIYILLEGPGLENSGLANPGKVDFTDDEKKEILAKLYRPGFAVTIGPDGVSDPFMPDAELLQRIYAAFTPTFASTDEGDNPPFNGSPEDTSGQGAQQGEQGVDTSNEQGETEDEDSEIEPPFTPTMGQTLTIPELDAFGSMFSAPDGHFLAVAPAQFFASFNGQPRQQLTSGVALMQMHVDFSTRTVAPEAALSFTILDSSVSNPADLSVDNMDMLPDVNFEPTIDAYRQAQLDNIGFSFDTGVGGFANFVTAFYNLTLRQSALPNSVALDAGVTFVGPSDPQFVLSADAFFQGLEIIPGQSELVFFDSDNFDLAQVFSIAELDAFPASGLVKYAGFNDLAVSTLGSPAIIPGYGYTEMMVDFGARTIGGPGSFLFITASANPAIGAGRNVFVPFGTAVPWSSGVFNMAIVPLDPATADPNFVAGEFVAALIDACCFGGLVAATLDAGGGAHLYTLIDELFDQSNANPITSFAALDAIPAAVARYDGSQQPGFAEFTDAAGVGASGFAFASLDIDFGAKTIGGGNSFVQVAINDSLANIFVNFTENVGVINFNRAQGNLALFGLDNADFNGANVTAGLLRLLTTPNPSVGPPIPAGEGLLNFTFTDGAGGEGHADVGPMPVVPGPTP